MSSKSSQDISSLTVSVISHNLKAIISHDQVTLGVGKFSLLKILFFVICASARLYGWECKDNKDQN